MKKNYILSAFLVLLALSGFSQSSLHQVLVGSGGAFGNPDDHMMLSAYDPVAQSSTAFGEVVRESMQDMIIAGPSVFITAEDSIVKFNLATHVKEAAIYEPNLNRLYAWGDYLLVSRRSDINGAPADGIYLKVYLADDLSLIAGVEGISSDAAGITVSQDSIYLAVPGDWTATEGHLAVIETTSWLMVREMNLGTEAVGIVDLFGDDTSVFSVNKTPYLGTTGSITHYSVMDASYTTTAINHVIGKGFARTGQTLYLGVDNGIGSFNLQTAQMIDDTLIPDPGSASFIYISSAAFDSLNETFYVATTDYFSMGEGKIFDLTGTETGSFDAGISTEAIALDYQSPNGLKPVSNETCVGLYPNPAHNYLYIATTAKVLSMQAFDLMGNVVLDIASSDFRKIDISTLTRGYYFLKVKTENGLEVHRILKQ